MNGIWLCSVCHGRVDDDPDAYSEDKLFQWKQDHAKFVRQLVGKHFDIALFEVYARSRNTAECFAFLTFIENRRVFFERLDVEYPWQVVDSLMAVRTRINDACGHLLQGEPAVIEMSAMLKAIHQFLSANPALRDLRCDGNDPAFQQFGRELRQLRTVLLPHVLKLAASVDYKLSAEILAEADRLQRYANAA